MSFELSVAELKKLPYLRLVPRDGRMVPLLPFHELHSNEWHLYMPVRPGELGRIAGGEPISASYIATHAEDGARDLEFRLGTLVMQRLSFSGIVEQLHRLDHGTRRCAAVLQKYDLVWRNRPALNHAGSSLVESELEYLLLLLRSMYDHLQRIVQGVAAKLVVSEENRPFVKNLPKSFREMVIKDGKVLTADVIAARWRLPLRLAEWYVAEASFFRFLRSLRDGIAHEGSRPPSVFELEWGFAIATDTPPWNQADEYLIGERWNDRLASLRGLFVQFIFHGLRALDRFAECIEGFVQLPDPIFIDVRYFVRSPFGLHLTQLAETRHQPWEARNAPASHTEASRDELKRL